MTRTYTVYGVGEEPENGHIFIGVFDSFDEAKEIAEQYKQYENVIIMENVIFGLAGAAWESVQSTSKEVWRFCYSNDEICS